MSGFKRFAFLLTVVALAGLSLSAQEKKAADPKEGEKVFEQCSVCHVSLETPMACGIGICFTCVAKIGSLHDWDYKRTCVEGPVFDAADVQWR